MEIDCKNCEFYDKDGDFCRTFECNGLECPDLPCEHPDASEELK